MIKDRSLQLVSFVFTISVLFKVTYFLFTYEDYSQSNLYMFINIDELRYSQRAIDIANDISVLGWSNVVNNYYTYTNSHHAIYYFILSVFVLVFGKAYAFWFVLFKIVVISTASLFFFHRLFSRYFIKKVVIRADLFLILYPVIGIYSFSLMRDDYIFLAFISSCYYLSLFIERRNILTTFFLLLSFIFLMQLRMSMLLLVIFFVFSMEYKKYNVSVLDFLKFTTLFAFVVYAINIFVGNYILSVIGNFPGLKVVIIEVLKMYFSPLPWKLSNSYQLLSWWFWFSFFSVTFSFLFIKKIIQSILANRLAILSVLFIYCFPYILRDGGVGLRQFGFIAPFLFILIYEKVLSLKNIQRL